MVDFIDSLDASFQKLPAKSKLGLIACIGAAVIGFGCTLNDTRDDVSAPHVEQATATPTPFPTPIPEPTATPSCADAIGMDKIKRAEAGECSCEGLTYPAWTDPAGACAQ